MDITFIHWLGKRKNLEGKNCEDSSIYFGQKLKFSIILSSHSYNYWLLYRLPELPDPSNPPGNQLIAPVGVDELMVEDGEHYLYWYKKL